MARPDPSCAQCPYKLEERLCIREEGKSPDFCATLKYPHLVQRCTEEYRRPDVSEFARQATVQTREGFLRKEDDADWKAPCKPRILEIAEFAQKMGYRRLGLVFCGGLGSEARTVEKFFVSAGFDVVSVMCKVGRLSKQEIGIDGTQGKDPMCNPILQAMVLNEAKTDFNVLLGLCVGHDSLFLKYSESLCTVLAVKDRLLGHNPLAAVYNMDSYYRYLKRGKPE